MWPENLMIKTQYFCNWIEYELVLDIILELEKI